MHAATPPREDRANESLVLPSVWERHERRIPSDDAQQTAVNTGPWPEPVGRDPAVKREHEPGGTLRGHQRAAADPGAFAGDLPLSQQDRRMPLAGREQASQDRSRQMVRDIPDDDGSIEGVAEGVAANHVDVWTTFAQCGDAVLIDVDGTKWSPERGERTGESPVAAADLQDWAVRRCGEFGDPGDRGPVSEKVLAEFMSAAV